MDMVLFARAWRWFLRLCVAWLSLEVILLRPRFFRLRAVVLGVGFGFNLRLHWGSSVIPSSLAENVGLSRLSLIRVSMKKFSSGRGSFLPGHSAPLVEPGTRQHRFFVYTLRSSIGFPLTGHLISGCAFILFHTLSRTKSLILPWALSLNMMSSAYRCQLFFHS